MSHEIERVIKLDRGPFRKVSMRGHATMYRLTGGKVGGSLSSSTGDRPVLVLTTTGCKTGRARTTPLIYLADGGDWLVVGSNAGRDTDPGWVHNLRAGPHAWVRIEREITSVNAVEVDPVEADQLWPLLDAMYDGYGFYRDYTDRRLPIFRLQPAYDTRT